MKKSKITFGKIRKPTPEELRCAMEADLIRTTERTNERLELIWKWKGSGLRALATDGEMERLTAVCERAEHAVYQCEIIERTYQQYKRRQRDLVAEDWREIINAIRCAELDPSGHEATPDWDWFVNHVLCIAQGLGAEGLKAALQARCDIISRVKKELANNQGASCEMLALLKKQLALQEEQLAVVKAYLTPRPADYQVSQPQLSKMLNARNCPKTVKQIQRWEKYLQTGGTGANATKPPKGYTLQTRLTLQTATAWVDSYTAQDNAKLKTKISFEARFGGRA